MTTGLRPYDRDAFAADLAVPRETVERLDIYARLLGEWQQRLNLVGPATLGDVWRRHFLDSAQLMALSGDHFGGSWVDIGTGAGFPGLVLAILGAGPVHLVESIAKKARFLEAVVAETGVEDRVTVHVARAESITGLSVDTITARACAPLERLIPWGLRFATPTSRWWLLKGASASEELTAAQRSWTVPHRIHPSRSDPRGQIIEAWGIAPRRPA
jgi:16S rRNA (guanine527-N7)-methyltransferase